MNTINTVINEYKFQLQKGEITTAYRCIMDLMMQMRKYFSREHPDFSVSGSPTSDC